MDARSAVEPGTADKRISSTSSRERRCGDRRTVLGDDAARGTRSARPRRAPPPRRRSRPSGGRGRRSRRCARGLHRVDQVVGGGAAVERLLEPRAGQEVAADHVHVVAASSGRRASARTGRPSSTRRRSRRPPTYPVAPVTSSMGESQYLPKIRPPEKCGASGASQSDPAKSAKPWVARAADLVLDRDSCRRRSPPAARTATSSRTCCARSTSASRARRSAPAERGLAPERQLAFVFRTERTTAAYAFPQPNAVTRRVSLRSCGSPCSASRRPGRTPAAPAPAT